MCRINKILEGSLLRTLSLSLLILGGVGLLPSEGLSDPFQVQFSRKPEHVILIVIDGLSYQVWDRMNLPILEQMTNSGALVERVYLPPAAHPRKGKYAQLHSCSIPNPVMMAGTVFITEETKYLQQVFFPNRVTAFVANDLAYQSLSGYYHYSFQKSCPDSEAIAMAIRIIQTEPPTFMRIHLQDSGEGGHRSMDAPENVAWKWNIWADNSPYRLKTEVADRLVGDFIRSLEEQGILGRTALIVLGDHGQADTGWHPLEIDDSSITTMVFWGAGIKKGVKIPYGEIIDAVPTICALMAVPPPQTSQGRVLAEVLLEYRGETSPPQENFKEMIRQFAEYRKKEADISAALVRHASSPQVGAWSTSFNQIKQDFLDIHEFVEWSSFKTVAELLENNSSALKRMDMLLQEIKKAE